MVKDGKITTEEGEKLIAAITASDQTPSKKVSKFSMLRVRIDAAEHGEQQKAKVNVNLPLSIAKKATSFVALTPKDVRADLLEKGIDLDSINLGELIEMFENGEITEDLVNIKTDDAEVRVYVD